MAKIEILGVQHDYQLTPAKSESEITVVFIHGWLLSQQYWQPVIEQVRSQFTCLSYDLRGFGASNQQSHPLLSTYPKLPRSIPAIASLVAEPWTYSHFSPAAYAHDLCLLLKALKIKRPWLVGHSLGGTIAVWAAAMSLNQADTDAFDLPAIEGIICLNSGGGIYVREEFNQFRNVGRQILKFRPSWLAKVPGLDWIFSRSNVASAVSRKWGLQLLTDFLRVNREAGERALLDSTTPEEVLLLPKLMAQIKQPTYFLTGDQDQVMAPKFVNHLASFHRLFHTSDGNVFELENCGHLGMIEQPQQVSELILKLIGRHIGS